MNDWEEQQKIEEIRKVYHRALSNPLDLIEQIWKDYDAFETEFNKVSVNLFINQSAKNLLPIDSQKKETQIHSKI